MANGSRREARERALSLLYEAELKENPASEDARNRALAISTRLRHVIIGK